MGVAAKYSAATAVVVAVLVGVPAVDHAQTPAAQPGASASAPTIACADSSATGVLGSTACTIFARRPVAKPDGPVFWTLETFPTRSAADRAKTATSAVVEIDNKIWLLSVGSSRPVPTGATREAQIGPLPLPTAASYEMLLAYVAVPPGSRSAVHVQSGPEAWYVLAGSQCVETPANVLHIDQGHGGMVPADTPLFLIATGSTMRHAFFVIVHDAGRPFYTEINSWKPTGACG